MIFVTPKQDYKINKLTLFINKNNVKSELFRKLLKPLHSALMENTKQEVKRSLGFFCDILE
jgi:hypothetical protein